MSTDPDGALGVAYRTLGEGARRTGFRYDSGNILYRLTAADYVSLVALFCAWVGALAYLDGDPRMGIAVTFVAFGFDKLDGWLARRLDVTSAMGRQVDSFIDIFVYLVTGALCFHYVLAPNRLASAVVGFLVLGFGGLRLIRHNEEGFIEEAGTKHYHGTTVVHTHLVVLANVVLATHVAAWNGWFAALTVALACPLMVSDYRAPKTDRAHYVLGVLCALVIVALYAPEVLS
jgi:CDP-diacylglycerol--serine O-phosphatidyltransferase